MTRRILLLAAAFACAAPPEGTETAQDLGTQPGDPLPGLTKAQLAAFNAGKAKFTTAESPAEGLGPVFNDNSCVACHAGPAAGGGSDRTTTRFGRVVDGVFDPMTSQGGSLIQERAIPGFTPEKVPPEATVVARRRTGPLFGFGLVDAVPDQVFRDLAARQRPEVRGIFAGKFGWKGQNPTVFQFAADAYLNEMGITNPLFTSENCPQGDCAALSNNPAPGLNDDGGDVSALADFISLLAPVAPSGKSPRGEGVFAAVGCAECHTPALAPNLHPYSDFLLHDMGALGDGITQGVATGRLMRTQPLWGLRFEHTLLHDGRAKSVAEAIEAHDGQAAFARDRYRNLRPDDRAALLAFLATL